MATPTDIVNIALRRIGANRISSLDNDSSKEAVAARDLFDEARRDTLSLCGWNGATKRTTLTASATSPTFGWDYAYILPYDYLRIMSVHPTDSDAAQVPYKLEFQSGDDRVILCNSTSVYLIYVFDQEDTTVMGAGFRDALAWRMARDLAGALSKSSAAAEMAEKMHRYILARVKGNDAMEDWPQQMAEGSWLTARYPDSTTSI